jgi:exonuclease VII small subunit
LNTKEIEIAVIEGVLSAHLSPIEKRIAALEESDRHRLAIIETFISKLEQRITALETSIDRFTNPASPLSVLRLEAKLESWIDNFEQRIAALEETLEKLESYLEKDGLLGEHNERISALDGTVSNLIITAENQYRRIAALEKALSKEACEPGTQLLADFGKRITALEDTLK